MNKDTTNHDHPLHRMINRRETRSVKWDGMESLFGVKEAIPLWVADMDFTAPEPVLKAVRDVAEHGILGYAAPNTSFQQSIADWMQKRHGWNVSPEWLVYTPGIVPALNMAVEAFTEPGDHIIIQPPVYGPFHKLASNHGRELVLNPLLHDELHYKMDLAHLEQVAKHEKAKMLVLCSPHNPIGRVWTKEELDNVMEIAAKHDLIVISDEIHADLVFKERLHTPYAMISEEAKMHSVICTAASKTFNIAGLHTSNVVIANEELRDKFKKIIEKNALSSMNIFGIAATEAAYREGEPWLIETLEYIHENMVYVTEFIHTHLPELKVELPESTYLLWIDFRNLQIPHKELYQFLLHEAGLVFSSGTDFGEHGEGFMRMNVACSRHLLEEAMNKLKIALQSR